MFELHLINGKIRLNFCLFQAYEIKIKTTETLAAYRTVLKAQLLPLFFN